MDNQWPISAISLALTEDCSLRCKYCFCGEKVHRNIDLQTAKNAVDWLLKPEVSVDNKNLQIDLWGGEPMLQWPLAKELILYGDNKARTAGKTIRWNMTTNGIHMTQKTCQEVALANVSYMLSLDGDKQSQDKYRPLAQGGSSYDVIVKNLPNMMAANPGLRARITVQEDNVGNMFTNFKHLREDLGIKQISHCLAHESAWEYDSICVLEEQLRLIADWYIQRKKEGDVALWIKFIDDGIGRMLYPKPLQYFCGAGRGYLAVSIDGVIYPCHRFDEFTDTRPWQEKPFALGTIYDGITNTKMRQQFIDAKANGKCIGCKLAKAGTCNGSCYAVNYVKSGDITIPASSSCQEMNIIHAIAPKVFNALINEPAFKPNLRQIAREMYKTNACHDPAHEFFYSPGMEEMQEGVKAEIDVLQSAMTNIDEAVAAIKEIAGNLAIQRYLQLEELSKENSNL